MFDTEKLKQIGMSYFRAAAAAVTALYMAGEHDPKKLAMAFVAGIVGPVMKALDTNSPEFGRTK
jgi:hypothetical protein